MCVFPVTEVLDDVLGDDMLPTVIHQPSETFEKLPDKRVDQRRLSRSRTESLTQSHMLLPDDTGDVEGVAALISA